MFNGLKRRLIDVSEMTINLVVGGAGLPVLLRGYPPTHVTRHRAAPLPAKRHTVIAASLRGSGDSGKPPSTADHTPFSRRAMAAPGFGRFRLVGHDLERSRRLPPCRRLGRGASTGNTRAFAGHCSGPWPVLTGFVEGKGGAAGAGDNAPALD